MAVERPEPWPIGALHQLGQFRVGERLVRPILDH